MKKPLHLSTLLFTTFLLLFLFAFPQVGRGAVEVVYDAHIYCTYYFNASESGYDPSKHILLKDANMCYAGVAREILIPHDSYYITQNDWNLLKSKIQETKANEASNNVSLSKITIKSHNVNATDWSGLCKNLRDLDSVIIDYLPVGTNLAGAFKNCASLESVFLVQMNPKMSIAQRLSWAVKH